MPCSVNCRPRSPAWGPTALTRRDSPGRSASSTSSSCWWWWASSTPARAPSSTPSSGRTSWPRASRRRPRGSPRSYGPANETRTAQPRAWPTSPAPVDLLRDLHIVDTPGTNAVLREHEALTTEFVPRADLVLSITSADRPFTESERQFLDRVRAWGKKIVFVVNKVDILERTSQVDEIVAFVARRTRRPCSGRTPRSSPSACAGPRQGRGDAAAWEASGMAAVDRLHRDHARRGGARAAEAEEPAGDRATRSARRCGANWPDRLALLRDDAQAVEQIERQLDAYAADMARDFEFRWADIEKVLFEMERRGHEHFDESIRLGRIKDLLNRSQGEGALRAAGRRPTLPQRLEAKVHELIDWMVNADFQQWQTITQRLAERRAAHAGREGHPLRWADSTRTASRLVESVGREAQRVVQAYDHGKEASEHRREGARVGRHVGRHRGWRGWPGRRHGHRGDDGVGGHHGSGDGRRAGDGGAARDSPSAPAGQAGTQAEGERPARATRALAAVRVRGRTAARASGACGRASSPTRVS